MFLVYCFFKKSTSKDVVLSNDLIQMNLGCLISKSYQSFKVVSLFCCQCSLFVALATAILDYHIFKCLSTTFFVRNLNLFSSVQPALASACL